MINVVINYDSQTKEYRLYEPTTDTIIITSNLSETFIKLSEFLVSSGMITGDLLNTDQVTYHLDSGTLISMVESNVNLLKRLMQQAPSVFASASQKFKGGASCGGLLPSQVAAQKTFNNNNNNSRKSTTDSFRGSSGVFSKSSFKNTKKKFGN